MAGGVKELFGLCGERIKGAMDGEGDTLHILRHSNIEPLPHRSWQLLV
jgi:hypothetical protein